MVTAGVQAQHNSGDHNLSNKSNKSKTIRESAEWRHYLALPLCLGDEEGEKLKSYCALNYSGLSCHMEVSH